MKKILLTMFLAVTTAVAMAQTTNYTDDLIVTVEGEPLEAQETTIIVEKCNDGTYTLSLNNFILGGMIPVGNIVVDGIVANDENGISTFSVNKNINITAGEGGTDEDWIGTQLGEIPVSLTGKMTAEKLYCAIDITMEGLGVINVVFGTDEFAPKKEIVETTNYTDDLVVTVEGEPLEAQETTIIVEKCSDGTYNLALNNFILGGMIPVGNIVVDGIVANDENGISTFSVNKNIIITAGEGGTDEDWIGTQLGEIPVSLTGKMTAEKLYCAIDITMEGLGVINVVFGSEDAVTGINGIAVENDAKVIYDITGRKINAISAPGIYIINGKKILVK